MQIPTERRRTWRDLLRTAFAARVPALSNDAIRKREAELRARFREIDLELTAAHARRDAALARLPANRREGWLTAVLTVVAVVLGAERGGSSIMPEEEALPFQRAEGGSWLRPIPVPVTRAAGGAVRANSPDGQIDLVLDDAGPRRRVVLTLRVLTNDFAAPVLLAIPADPTQMPIEIDPEPIADPAGLRLRYAAALPPGAYDLVVGNPRGIGSGSG